jgi:rubrerythrin
MGADLNTYTVSEDLTTEQVRKHFKEKQQELCYEYGNDGYAGHLGIKPGLSIKSLVFDSEDEAYDYIQENSDKWDDAIAVRFKAVVKKPSKSGRILQERYERLRDEVDNFESDVLREIKKAKSKNIGCKKCGSSIARKFLKSLSCPICNSYQQFVTPTNIKKYNRLKERRNVAQGRLIHVQQKDAAGHHWAIGGWCPC